MKQMINYKENSTFNLALEERDIKIINNCFFKLKKDGIIKIAHLIDLDDIIHQLRNFQIIKNYKEVRFINAFKVKEKQSYLIGTKLSYQEDYGTLTNYECQLFGIIVLQESFEHILIMPKSLPDKTFSIFNKKSKSYVKGYNILFEKGNYQKFEKIGLMPLIKRYKGIYIEIIDQLILLKYNKIIEEQDAINIISLMDEVKS